MASNNRQRPDLTAAERNMVISLLLQQGSMVDGEFALARGALSGVAKKIGCHPNTVSRIWKTAKDNWSDPKVNAYRATPQKKGNCGRMRKYEPEELKKAIAAIPLHKRRTIRSLAGALGIPKTSLFNMMRYYDDLVVEELEGITKNKPDDGDDEDDSEEGRAEPQATLPKLGQQDAKAMIERLLSHSVQNNFPEAATQGLQLFAKELDKQYLNQSRS